MHSTLSTGLTGLAALASVVSAFPFKLAETANCAAVSGTFEIENYKLYPENLDWDPIHCKLYISANFNSTVLVYDPYKATYDILSFDGITGVDPYHVSGIDYDATTQSILISANSGEPFVTSGSNMTGGNKVIRWDTNTNSAAYTVDLADFTSKLAINNSTGGGYQDFAEDKEGNTYVPSVFHVPAIAKITKDGELSSWYIGEPSSSSKYMYLGIIFHEASNKLVITAPYLGTFLSFDVGSSSPAPTNVSMTWPADGSYTASDLECDGLLNPARYNRDVLLCSENGLQAITLWASKDGFASVEYIGKVMDNSTTDIATWGSPTATVQIQNSIYISHEYFHDLNEFDVAGNRSTFPFVDATADFDKLVLAAGYNVTDC
ncbi:hypothetical protein HER10_EVM0005685 [Colletotrichum scovillei]|uniref:Trichothecene biosynthesis protein n=1 Tax=Colletotrichum scovillei TaxID=1209932 RepID=A0A9P7U7P8_9PEZI|nr:uncharacterized protein HER10_EVM0005685 [Colletotrichum scovillei]KAF4778486.1 hypothetical protein HER10_EVM0005685 [Colletotrichum scovillei]KAG7038525.1 putative trichothecene biosynthesis protein [Colletotrichum scovillei]KAG7040704.1 putative trichothecene biosynthesis protein [Colletotrichum scovillei]KAG7060748.1 putative trichothecene biosynthesis protein [Colletotrichum scovillei]